MNTLILIKNTVLNLKANKLRLFLTMIGIIIGISAVVAILSVGAGLQAEVSKSTENTDVNSLKIAFESKSGLSNITEPFTKSDFNSLKNIDGVSEVTDASNEGIAGMSVTTAEASYFGKQTYLIMSEYKDQKLNLLAGRTFNKEDNEFKNKVVILTEAHAKDLFGDDVESSIGKGIKINNEFYNVTGIVKDNAAASLFNFSSDYVPAFVKDNIKNDYIYSINVKVKDGYNSDEVFKDVKSELERLHPDVNGEYKKNDPQELVKAFQQIISYITLFITAVSAISLFVAGVGVMNIMYVSVSERRREIGIRRAIGAKPKMILIQFLVEAVLITAMGGLLGILCGFGISKIIGIFLPFKPVLTVGILFGSSITSVIVGIVFGIIPAFKAAKMDPIKAIYK
ncbi:MAG: ABC transporter permease [Clostridiaceae bacterium]